jgi:hypothetical protein
MRERNNQNEARKARKEEELELKTEAGYNDPTPQEAVHNIIIGREKKWNLKAELTN